MSIVSEAILSGHVTVERIVGLLKSEISGTIAVRDMQHLECKIIEFQKVNGSWSTFNLFLNSYAADDYADAFEGPSTFVTTKYGPQNFNLLRSIAGGIARRAQAEPWIQLKFAQI